MKSEGFKKVNSTSDMPSLPSLSIEEMLEVSKIDPLLFEEISKKAGHEKPETFLEVLRKAQKHKETSPGKITFDSYSIKRYAMEPDPAFDQYYIDLEIRINRYINTAKGSTPRTYEKIIARVQDAYRQLYDREKHKMIYERVKKGVDLVTAYNEVEMIFKKRSEQNMTQSDLPYAFREAESKAMLGIYAKGIGEVDMASDILGPSLKFGELGIQNKRGGLSGGRTYWPRGKPDTSIDE